MLATIPVSGPLAHAWLEQRTHNPLVPCSTHGRPTNICVTKRDVHSVLKAKVQQECAPAFVAFMRCDAFQFCLPYLVISGFRNFLPMDLRMDPNGKSASASIAIHLTEHSEIYQTCCPFHGASSDYIYVRNRSFYVRLETYYLPAGKILLLPQLRVTAGTAVAESISISLSRVHLRNFNDSVLRVDKLNFLNHGVRHDQP